MANLEKNGNNDPKKIITPRNFLIFLGICNCILLIYIVFQINQKNPDPITQVPCGELSTFSSNIKWIVRHDRIQWDEKTGKYANLRLRSKPSVDAPKIALLQPGEVVTILETGKSDTLGGMTGNWVRVRCSDGTIGWCFDAYLASTD